MKFFSVVGGEAECGGEDPGLVLSPRVFRAQKVVAELSHLHEGVLCVRQFWHRRRVAGLSTLCRSPRSLSYDSAPLLLAVRNNHVIIAFHWHPAERFEVRHPHLDRGAKEGREDLHRTHIPTGRVALEDVIRFAIMELGVEPKRADWERVLSDAQEAYRRERTWS